MRKLIYLFTISSVVSLSSCGDPENTTSGGEKDGDSTQVESTGDIDIKGLREIDLKEHDLDVTVMIPEKYYKDEDGAEWYVQPDIKHNEGEARWEITLPGDKYWNMVIEDWGDEKYDVAKEKLEHEDQKDIFDFIYEEEGADYMLYSKVLKQENTTINPEDAKMLANYHFFVSKNINGTWIIARSNEMKDFRGVTARQMLNAARAMKASE